MKRNEYESPRTSRSCIVVESAFCGASSDVTNPDNKNGRIDEHGIGSTITFDENNGWDIDPTI